MLGEIIPGLEELLKLSEGLCPTARSYSFVTVFTPLPPAAAARSLLFSLSLMSKFLRLGTRLRNTSGLYVGKRASTID